MVRPSLSGVTIWDESGESLANVQLAPVLQAVGVPLYRGGAEPFQVAGFETPAYLAFLISDLPEEKNIQLAATLAPGVHAFLNL
jgi:hypothetical protein